MRNLSAVNLIWFVGANRDPGDSGHRDLFFVLIFYVITFASGSARYKGDSCRSRYGLSRSLRATGH